MRLFIALLLSAICAHAESNAERGKRVVDQAIAALGGDRFVGMNNRVQTGRAYSFYREKLNGLSIAKMYIRYLPGVKDTAKSLAVEEYEVFGKKQDAGGVLFTPGEAYDVTYRGARPIVADQFTRYKESTLHDVLYFFRVRMKEPGLLFESRGSDVLQNRPVEIVDITDANNDVITVYFDQTTKFPLREVYSRIDPETKLRDEEVTIFSKYRDIGNGAFWPFDLQRERNGEKVYEMYSDDIKEGEDIPEKYFTLPTGIKLLKPVR